MTNLSARRVVVTQRFFDPTAIAYLENHGCDVLVAELPAGQADGDVPVETLLDWLAGASGWIVGHARVTADLLRALPELRVISRRGVGYDRVDTSAVSELGRVATIAAGGNDATVADQAIGMMIALGRRFREGQDNVARGSLAIPLGQDLYGSTVGVIGFGRVGRSVARRLVGFDTKTVVYQPNWPAADADPWGVERADLGELLATSDYVTIHAPLTAQTRFMIRRETMARMKPTAFVINTARGGLIEDRDLLEALTAGSLAGAGLDVFVSESDPSYASVTRALALLPNVIAQPHSGASTQGGLERTNMIAARCVVAVLEGTPLPAGCVVADGRNSVAATAKA